MDFMTANGHHPSVVEFGNCMNTITSIANNINPPSESARMGMELEPEVEAIHCNAANLLTPAPTLSLETSFARELSFEQANFQHSFTLKSAGAVLNPLGNSSFLNHHNIAHSLNTSLNTTATCLESGSDRGIESRINTKPLINSVGLNGVLSAASNLNNSGNINTTQLRHQTTLTRNNSMMNNSSKIVLNTSANFSSIRIEKKVLPDDDGSSNLKQIIQNIPELNEIFQIQEKVGEGTFSKVYRAKHLKTDQEYALKCIIPTIKPSRIIPELRYLRDMGGDSNVIEIKTCMFGGGFTVLVMPYFQHDRFVDYVLTMSVLEIKDYMRALLVALRKIHCNGVIHRDVKPNNFLYNRAEKLYALVDFGLAQNEVDLMKLSKTVSAQHPTAVRSKMSSVDNSQRFTANQVLAKQEAKLICVRKRLLMDEPSHAQAKRSKFETPVKQQSSVFGTPLTPRSKGLQNMTNLAPAFAPAPLPELAPLQMSQPRALMSTPVKQTGVGQTLDPFKTPTKRDKENFFGCMGSSPARQVIPETPPKSAKMQSAVSKQIQSLRTRSPTKQTPTSTAVSFGVSAKSAVAKESLAANNCNTDANHISNQSHMPAAQSSTSRCNCYGSDQFCKLCMRRLDLVAPRAGTPGFRAPEVLLKQLNQTTAIDIWSAGVIFASLLSRRYPFFRNADDLTSLAEIISLFGTKRVSNAAYAIGRTIVTSAKHLPPMDLKKVCLSLRGDDTPIDDSAFDLLDKLLDPNPNTRITAADALNHPFLANPYLL